MAKIQIEPRPGKPTQCIVCNKELHPKSEYYCSQPCNQDLVGRAQDNPAFLSKWKMRKRREAKDPLEKLRKKTRQKTQDLVQRGKLKRKPCTVCDKKEVIVHHEDYRNPFRVIWICEAHHKQYHNGEIGLFGSTLWWDPKRLIPKGFLKTSAMPRKYRTLVELHSTARK